MQSFDHYKALPPSQLPPGGSAATTDATWEGRTKSGRSWCVRLGDAQTLLQSLPECSFNCVVTSPPYYSLRDYRISQQIGLEETVPQYIDKVASAMDQVYRVLTEDGVLFLNLGDTYYSGKGESQGADPKSSKRRFGLRPVDRSGGVGIGIRPKSMIGIPWRVAIEMGCRRWVLRSAIIWHRKHALPEAVRDRPRRSYENIFMFVKNRKYYFNRPRLVEVVAGKRFIEEDVWTIVARPKLSNGLDTAAFPDDVVQRCLDLGCPADGRVLDPFAGSGTTVRVAVCSGRDSTGIDVNPEFCKFMVEQLSSL
jgi:DNA modification methylase